MRFAKSKLLPSDMGGTYFVVISKNRPILLGQFFGLNENHAIVARVYDRGDHRRHRRQQI